MFSDLNGENCENEQYLTCVKHLKASVVCDVILQTMGCLAEISDFISFSDQEVRINNLSLFRGCLWSKLLCVPIFQAKEFEFLQNSARTEFLKTVNTVNTLLFLYVVKKGSFYLITVCS